MSLEQLKYFCAIVEQGSFRAAAESMFRSQSSLSVSIQKLEQSLAITLFKRDGYRPTLTAAGQAIYHQAKVLLKKEVELYALAQHLALGNEAEIKIAVSAIVPIEPIIDVLNRLHATHPDTRFTLLIENLGGTMERLHDDDADIVITDAFEPHSDYISTAMMDVHFVHVIPSDAAWAKKASALNESDLEQETLIVVRDTSTHSPRLSKGVLEGAPQWVVNDFSTKKQMIKSGAGWGRMPLHLVEEDIQSGALILLKSDVFSPMLIPIHLVRKKHRPMGPVEEKLWSMLLLASTDVLAC